METIYHVFFGIAIGVLVSWVYATLLKGPLPTPEQMRMIVVQAIKAVSDAEFIEGSGPLKAGRAIELLGNALVSVGVKLDTKLLGIIVEAVYQYGKLADRPNIQ